jgi:hypothetical protein
MRGSRSLILPVFDTVPPLQTTTSLGRQLSRSSGGKLSVLLAQPGSPVAMPDVTASQKIRVLSLRIAKL